MKTYMVVIAELSDREAFLSGYAKAAAPLVQKFGGRYLVRGQGAKLLEGAWGDGTSLLISEWPDREAAEKFWNSTEYAKVKKLREGIAKVQVLLMDAKTLTTEGEMP